MSAFILNCNGDRIPVKPAKGKKFDLKELQKMVGGYIQIIELENGKLMIMDEEGKIHKKPKNEFAGLMAATAGLMPGDDIVGVVVIIERNQFE